jgi:hypothetical protein
MAFGRRGMFGVLVALVVACASPTLPLPPPQDPTLTNSGNGMYHLHGAPGSAEAGALILVINDFAGPTDRGVISAVNNDGSWDADIAGKKGDVLTITQEFGNTKSTPINPKPVLP